ncbi:hypothetical protein [Allocoleopsis franciscana]|uniref:Transmembrane protein n=1 Tax=Allocoleopsis franciscana PCC 7113 TaxID=1173027 RepID=K9WLD4_9CYAN|nr:hypothetical protein [Allocoleopsis franciscana]AFZ20601.1 hypothetical protein Mic7113_4940 [Allocoleopsis franciscana PCC 7113]
MKTLTPKQPASEQNEKRLQPTQPSNSKLKSRKTRKWLKFVEFGVVGCATWLNPNAGFLIFLLKLCFQILELLQDERER